MERRKFTTEFKVEAIRLVKVGEGHLTRRHNRTPHISPIKVSDLVVF